MPPTAGWPAPNADGHRADPSSLADPRESRTVPPVAVQLSYRLGGADGVAVEARKWEWALRELGFDVRRVAGELDDGVRPDDTWLPFLAIEPVEDGAPEPDALAAAIAGADLVIVENLCSLPINPDASALTAAVLADHDGRVAFHHHDLPWQRAGLPTPANIPPHRDDSLHVTINDHSRVQLENRGFAAVTLRNAFDLEPRRGDRDGTRAQFGFTPDDLVLLQPTRAIPRKNIPAAIAFAAELAAREPDRSVRLWITGPAEDGYDDVFSRLLAESVVPVNVGRAATAGDAYAAADLILFPSTWEGFGNPVIESIAHRRAIAVGSYPVLDELRAFGVHLLPIDDVDAVRGWLRSPDPAVLERNVDLVRPHCSLADLPERIGQLFDAAGWGRW
jgi:glycosyltransferase involved in cell wall biosynthesis